MNEQAEKRWWSRNPLTPQLDLVAKKVKKGARLGAGLLNAVMGDYLQEKESGIAIKMHFCLDCQTIPLNAKALQHFYPKASPKICILVHGLGADESFWGLGAPPNTTYGSLLQKDMGYTPFYLRYNSGLHISENGKALSALILELIKAYPIAVEEITIIAHSMGGLVVRSACHYGQNLEWTDKLEKVFFLGTPHLGAPLEKVGNVVSNILKVVPNLQTRIIAEIINRRSAGIKDLRYGYLIDEDWEGRNPDEWLKNNKKRVPLLEDVDYYIITSTLAKKSDHFIHRWIGDGMVLKHSAKGEQDFVFPQKHHREFSNIAHIRLTYQAEIYEQIKAWISSNL